MSKLAGAARSFQVIALGDPGNTAGAREELDKAEGFCRQALELRRQFCAV